MIQTILTILAIASRFISDYSQDGEFVTATILTVLQKRGGDILSGCDIDRNSGLCANGRIF